MSRPKHERTRPIPLEGVHAELPLVAGPPDDGHTGSFTRPGDVLVVGHAESAETRERRPGATDRGFAM